MLRGFQIAKIIEATAGIFDGDLREAVDSEIHGLPKSQFKVVDEPEGLSSNTWKRPQEPLVRYRSGMAFLKIPVRKSLPACLVKCLQV